MDANLRLRCLRADPRALGDRLRETRLAAGLTQVEVTAGVASSAHLSRIEAGLRRPTPALLAALADRLGVSVEGLLEEAPACLHPDHDHDSGRDRASVPWPEHLRAVNAARSAACWLRSPGDARAYRRMLAAVAAWEDEQDQC